MKEIKLTQGMVALVDDEDFERINAVSWYTIRCSKGSGYMVRYYAVRNFRVRPGRHPKGRQNRIWMHHLLLEKIPGYEIDHIDGNGLNNCKNNLRYVTHSENLMNGRKTTINKSSKFKGVSWCEKDKRWDSRIRREGHQFFLGHFNSEEEAAKVYDEAAKELFEDKARLNF